MKKITHLVLSLSLCSVGYVTASYVAPSFQTSPNQTLQAINDTILTDDEEEFEDEDLSDDEEESLFTEEEEDEFGEMHDENDDSPIVSANVNDSTVTEIEMTEGMMMDVNEQLEEWNAKHHLSGDTTSMQSNSPATDDAEYIRRLKRIPAIMEMPYNDIVRKYIDQYTGRLSRSVSMMLGAQNFYIPMFEEALEAEGCPLELKYLPIIESALNPAATSRVGAAGLWQFMIPTAKQFGMEVNSLVDERRDPLKSSKAAAQYFQKLYNRFGDWTLVIAAYNCGPNNVEKAIQRADGSKDYWQIYPYLPRETRGYVPAFIAANYIMQYYCEHGIEPMQATLPEESDTIMVSQDLHFQQVADLCEVDIEQIKALNPQYRQQIVPGFWKPCPLRLPTEAVSKFIASSDTIYSYRASELLPRRSTVTVNDTYAPVIHSGNGGVKGKSSYSHNSKKKKKTSSSRSVTIRQGDTLSAIAKRNGTTVAKLRQINGISGNNIRAGKKIRVR